ncbi:MAG: TauD/TfdA family dioxygenase [Planctomycetota bacterium]|nr:TauD/TfdA family dioxygenase [Planctomycetota bacterium]
MSQSPFTPFVLDESRRQAWLRAALQIRPSGASHDELLAPAARLAREYLPKELFAALTDVTRPHGPSVCLIDNLPIDPALPSPPTDGRRPNQKTTWVSELVLLGATRALGLELVTFLQEKRGAWPQEVAPVTGLEKTNSSASREEFGAHADNAILPTWVRLWISLIGLVNENQTETYFAPLDDILSALEPRIVDRLWEPIYRVTFPESFEMGREYFKTQPILFRGPAGETEIKFTAYSVVGTTPEGEAAVTALRNVLPGLLRPAVLKPGTLCLFSNSRALHARGRIEGARWAQRIYLGQPQTLVNLQTVTGAGPSNRVFDARLLATP